MTEPTPDYTTDSITTRGTLLEAIANAQARVMDATEALNRAIAEYQQWSVEVRACLEDVIEALQH